MAAVSMFWDTNMAAVMSCEYALLPFVQPVSSRAGLCLFNIQFFTSNNIIIIYIHTFNYIYTYIHLILKVPKFTNPYICSTCTS